MCILKFLPIVITQTCSCPFDLPVKKYPLILRHDNRKFEGYERPCAGFEEVSLTSLTEHIK